MFLHKWLGIDDLKSAYEQELSLLRANLKAVINENERLVGRAAVTKDLMMLTGRPDYTLMSKKPPGPVLSMIIDYTSRCQQARQAINPVTFYQIVFEKIKDTNDQSDRMRGEGLLGSTASSGSTNAVPPTVANNGVDPR